MVGEVVGQSASQVRKKTTRVLGGERKTGEISLAKEERTKSMGDLVPKNRNKGYRVRFRGRWEGNAERGKSANTGKG